MDANSSLQDAKSRIEKLTVKPTNDDLLILYGLYKQSTVGNNDQEEPSGFDFKGMLKHRAWLSQRGKSKEQAEKEYIDFVEQLVDKYQ